jgi:hypothetical protein
MKVKFVKLIDINGNKIQHSQWLSLNNTYHVLSITIESSGNRLYELVSYHKDGEWPISALHNADEFEIVSIKIPSNWQFWLDENGNMGAAPKKWLENGFYEAFYDRDPAVYDIFENERNIIIQEDP